MDFDEYEYLESTVENPEKKPSELKVNGNHGTVGSEEKDLNRKLKQRHNADDCDDSNHPPKRPREGKYETSNRNRMSHQGSSSRNEDVENDQNNLNIRNRDKEEGSGRERGRNRHRERERERERDKENDQNRNKRDPVQGYEGGTIKEGERDRLRLSKRFPERHPGELEKEVRDRQRNADKGNKERRGVREFADRDRDTRRYKDKKDEAPVADPERDQRTVFAYQISLKASERDVYDFFSRAGKVRDVQLIMDRNSRRSKGFGYIEFYDVMSVPMAIALCGQLLLGQPVMVKPSEAEKNLVQSTSAASGEGGLGPYSGGARRLYVGNLPVTIKEDQLRQVFEPFGAVELLQMPTDPGTGNCKGYAFIQFARLEDANAAQNLNGELEIAGRAIKVSAVTDPSGIQNTMANITDLDDDDGSGLSLNAQSRALLMQKLDRTGTASSPGVSVPSAPFGSSSAHGLPGLAAAVFPIPAVTGPSIDAVGIPSECLLLKNMFDPNYEAETDFELDVKEDVQDECSKFGKLQHIYVDKNSAGCVYLRFENTQCSAAAQRALHGRWFAGKMITASFMVHFCLFHFF
ncbi:RNA-binding protein 39 [Dorcoceras hygrometricum]|uniref:RNA-binding protein 39 n=1 Tax=Dorcoceras hygrometricum TaxID=472368 RepID=A0A2Z7C9W2_9LAMI|nr:RNA-binding protein 39 [Dorcoceras hygrometricum]